MSDQAEDEQHAQNLKEKESRDGRMTAPMNWPHDPNGEPMAIVFSQASELAKTVQFANVTLGPVGAMVPCVNDKETIQKTMQEYQKLAQYIVATERRLLQWAIDPTSKVTMAEAAGGESK